MDFGKIKEGYFCGADWTVSRALKALTNIAFWRTRIGGGCNDGDARGLSCWNVHGTGDLPDERADMRPSSAPGAGSQGAAARHVAANSVA
ncbi:hypothetical protein ACQR1I_14090 [Bradyrhizobium sp. HKCCYLS2038]|uniref:hypothetical protein n=1 Tax=unclassified Bradyrhizobium TaxID=2631580 RepID=UPI003EB7572E